MSYNQHGTDNYVWTEKNKLGQGAAGAVYRAWHRNTGDLVAVKTFPVTPGYRIPREIQNREFDILNRLSHENIVRLLATETVGRMGGGVALIMELCEGGSLLDVLDQPVNACGLDEEEFLLVLQHLTSGIKYLRQSDIVHRDIKPGNIMRHVTDTGSSIYKIADFGTARELEPDSQFQSLCGTEEYLNPQLYKQAVLRRDPSIIDPNEGFSAVTDLWSIGVTLYHCATGQLPFRSYEGRTTARGRETVYKITTEKASGVISGVQSTRNGQIEWSHELPQQCRLSQGLRLIVTPLLAGLLECQPSKIWTFEKYFSEADDITRRRTVYVFDGLGSGLLRVYLSTGASTPFAEAAEFRKLVEQQTGIKRENQLILFNGAEVGLEEAPSSKTTPSNPLFVYISSTTHTTKDSSFLQNHIIPSLPEQPNSTLPEANYFYITACCEVINYIRHTVSDLLHNSALLGAAAATYRRHLVHQMIATQRAAVDKTASMSNELGTRLNVFVEHESNQGCESLSQPGDNRVSECMDMNSAVTELSEKTRAEHKKAEDQLDKSVKDAEPLFERGSDVDSWRRDENLLSEFVDKITLAEHKKAEDKLDKSVKDAESLFERSSEVDSWRRDENLLRLDEILKSLERQRSDWKNDWRNARNLSEDRVLDQKYGRKKLPEICKQALSILSDWCLPRVKYRRGLYKEWMTKTTSLRTNLKSSEETLDRLRGMRKIFVEAFDRLMLCHHPTAVLDNIDGHSRGVRAVGYPGMGGLGLPKPSTGVTQSSSTPNLLHINNTPGPSGRAYSSSGNSTNSSSNSSSNNSNYNIISENSKISAAGISPANSGNLAGISQDSAMAYGAGAVGGAAASGSNDLQEWIEVLQESDGENFLATGDMESFIKEQAELLERAKFSPASPRGRFFGVQGSN